MGNRIRKLENRVGQIDANLEGQTPNESNENITSLDLRLSKLEHTPASAGLPRTEGQQQFPLHPDPACRLPPCQVNIDEFPSDMEDPFEDPRTVKEAKDYWFRALAFSDLRDHRARRTKNSVSATTLSVNWFFAISQLQPVFCQSLTLAFSRSPLRHPAKKQ